MSRSPGRIFRSRRLPACALALVCLAAVVLRPGTTDESRLQRLMSDILIFDAHVDTPWYIADEGYNLAQEHTYYEVDIPRLRRGRAGAILFGVVAEPDVFPPEQWLLRSLLVIDSVRQEVERNPQSIALAWSADDVERAARDGKIAALLSLEGGHLIADSLPALRSFARLGVRSMTLTHFNTNNWADSSGDRAVHGGLSPFGREVVAEMNRLAMLVDVSHVADKTFYDVLETTQAPVVASHSSVRALCDVPRNVSDEMIRQLARNGGAIFINFGTIYIDRKAYDSFLTFREERGREAARVLALNLSDPNRWALKRAVLQRYRARLPEVDIQDVLRHIDHVVKLVGADYVGVGSDFDGISGMVPKGLEDVSKYPELVRRMLELGYSDADIRKIMGGNLIRIMRRNEAVAERLKATPRK